jgi:hypothetical protein
MAYQYHVTCGKSKKIVRPIEKNNAAIIESIKQEFAIAEMLPLQIWSNDFEDWLDVDWAGEIPDKGKFLVTPILAGNCSIASCLLLYHFYLIIIVFQ